MAQTIENFQMRFDLLQPWSTFVMKTQLPSPIFEKMIKITDEIVENKESATSAGEGLAGQIEDEFHIALNILEQEELMVFFLNVCKTYAVQAFCQTFPLSKEKYLKEEWQQQLETEITYMWIVSQKDNEYNPIHTHTNSHLSAVMYLKIPEFLPVRKSHRDLDDGAIGFTNNVGKDPLWGNSTITLRPQVGDFFIFPASQQHFVYPFRTVDGRGERRSVSFNAVINNLQWEPAEPLKTVY